MSGAKFCAHDCACPGAKLCAHDCAFSGATLGAYDCDVKIITNIGRIVCLMNSYLQSRCSANYVLIMIVLFLVPFFVLVVVLVLVLNFVLMIVFFLVLKVAIDLIRWAFKSWCSFLPL